MVNFKLVMATKDGKSYQKEVADDSAKFFVNKKIGDTVKGEDFGFPGLEAKITGGSDSSGFPMRYDVVGNNRKRILAVKGIGIKKKRDGQRQRKTVCGNTVHENIAQINLKVLKEGKEKLGGNPEQSAEGEESKEAAKDSKKE